MENRICRIFLKTLLAALALTGAQLSFAEEAADNDDSLTVEESSPLIEPYVMRLDLEEAEIDTENFEIGIHFGRISVEDFGTNDMITATAAYHITEDFFVEAAYGVTELQQPVVSDFVQQNLIREDDLDYEHYNLSLGINILPGEAFVWEDWAFNSQFYLIGGVGTTEYVLDIKETTFNIGAGYRLILWDWFALRFDVRDHVFKRDGVLSDAFGESSENITNNFELRAGVSVFF